MKAKTITAKLRDAVPVRFMEGQEEKAQYRNIDIPDSLKELEIQDFKFDVPEDGKITFQLFFDEGILPEGFPAIREKMTRAEKAAAKVAVAETVEKPALPAVIITIPEPLEIDEATSAESNKMEIAYNVTGDRRKELVTAISEIIGWEPIYKKAPTYAYAIGNYLIDRYGTLTGESNQDLIDALAERGFVTE